MIDFESILNKTASISLDQRLSRRGMLALSTTGLLLLGSGKANARVEAEQTPEELAAQYYRQNLEEKYGFSLLEMQEFIQKVPNLGAPWETPKPQRWIMEQLTTIDDLFAVFPDRFANPRLRIEEYTQPLAIVLDSTTKRCPIACSTIKELPAIRLSDQLLTNRYDCLDTLAHEEGHILTPDLWDIPVPEMDAIFGGSYTDARPGMIAKLVNYRRKLIKDVGTKKSEDLTDLDRERAEFYKRMHYGIYSNDPEEAEFPTEFIANLSTYYIHGKGYFHHYLGELFTNDQVKALYDFCQDRFYGDVEYDHLPIAA